MKAKRKSRRVQRRTPRACSLFLVLIEGVPFAAYPRRKQAEVYADGFSKPTEIIEGAFTANVGTHGRGIPRTVE